MAYKKIEKYVIAHTGYQGIKITDAGVLWNNKEGNEELIPGTSVVCAVGQKANRDSVNKLLNIAPVVRQIGDCVCPSNITNAIYQGYHAGLDI